MKFRDYSVTQILVGLHRMGVVGLRAAIRAGEESGLTDREELTTSMMEVLAGQNYIPENIRDAYRIAVWREYLRHRGEDCSDFYSELPVVIRSDPGEARDRFVATVRSALARSELRPAAAFAPAQAPATAPQLLIGSRVVADGSQSWRDVEAAIRQSLSDW